MQKLRSLLGLPILETKSGTQIGEVQEVVLDMEKASVAGIIVSDANWFTQARGILLRDIFSVGRDAVMVRDENVVKELSVLHDTVSVYRMKELFDKQIFTETGFSLGTLVDILFDEATGEIKDYEVSDGLVADLLQGRRILPLPQVQIVSADKLIVPEAMAKLLHAEQSDMV